MWGHSTINIGIIIIEKKNQLLKISFKKIAKKHKSFHKTTEKL